MVEKVITTPRNVVDFARYQQGRKIAGMALAMSARACRHCGAALLEGESEDECSSAFNIEAPRLRRGPRRFYAD
jgi:lipoate-protein ligase A